MQIKKALTGVVTAAIMVFAGGCSIPISQSQTNSNLFDEPAEFGARWDQLESGMTHSEVFDALEVSYRLFRALPTSELLGIVYGDFEVRGTPTELEAFRDRLMAYDGYELTYRSIERSRRLGLGKVNVDRKGYDQKFVLIFDHGRLHQALIMGNAVVQNTESAYIWEMLGGVVQSGAKAVLP